MMNRVTAIDIDRYIHFSSRKHLNTLHDELMVDVDTKVEQANANLQGRFATYDTQNTG